MKEPRTRREFLADVGRAAVTAGVGLATAADLGLASAADDQEPGPLAFGPLEPLVCFMQETPVDRLLPALVEKLKAGTELKTLVAAAALANARTFGGEDYVGFHTMMALSPAWHMACELPSELRPLAVFKVLYRNTARIREFGGRGREVLRTVQPQSGHLGGACPASGENVRDAVRRNEGDLAERYFASMARNPKYMLDQVLYVVRDHPEVHRVALPYRAWDLLDVVGKEHAHTLLRQSLRYCIKADSRGGGAGRDELRTLLLKLFEEHKFQQRPVGDRAADDAWVEGMSRTIFQAAPEQAAGAAAAALAEGMAPDAVGEAISLAANQLVLRDIGRTARDESGGKPLGSVHGDSIGVHACDAANAWRHLARAAGHIQSHACLILGAWQVARDRAGRGGDFLNWPPLPLASNLDRVKAADPESLLRELDGAIRENLQARATAVVHRAGELGHPPRPVFDLLLRYAVSEDGALHAEKYYRTVSEEFAATRPAFRWRQLAALARVTASEFGRPAAGYAEARKLLGV